MPGAGRRRVKVGLKPGGQAADKNDMSPTVSRLALAGITVSLWLPLAAWAAAEAPALEISPDGQTVIDAKARLAWPRCVEGMSWSGKKCTGQPQLMAQAQARNHAADRRKAEQLPWRLPRAAELRRLVRRGGQSGVDPKLFPNAPADWHWTATVNADAERVNPYNYGNVMKGRDLPSNAENAFARGWAVDMQTGEATGDAPRNGRLVVRLVRDLPATAAAAASSAP